jgi:hypothetical protein
MATDLTRIRQIVEKAGDLFKQRMESLKANGGTIPKEKYIRYLSMQYHLTKDVQRPFMICASHPSLARRKPLREFLFKFALEEEPHYMVAKKDLENMGIEPLPIPAETEIWWAYFNSIIFEKPLIRLGATCVLENIGIKSHSVIDELFAKADYLTKTNTVFFQIHKHGPNLNHGAEIFEALEEADLNEEMLGDCIKGAKIGTKLYMDMADWALGESLIEKL